AVGERAAFGIGDDQLERGDRQALAHAGPLVDLAIRARLEGHFFDDLAHVVRDLDRACPDALRPGLLSGDRDRVRTRHRVMRADFGSDSILERRDDLAARRVVFRIRREHEQDIELQPDRVALDLDVALLKDVEQPDLNLAREIGQLVDGEDAAIGPRQQAVMHRQLVGEIQARLRRLDRIDVSHHVRDRDVGSRQLLDVPRVARQPRDGHRVAFLRDPRTARRADRLQRVVVDLAAGYDRDPFVEQVGQGSKNSALRLSAKAEENKIVTRQDGVDELGDDGFVEPDNAGEQSLAGLKLPDQIVANFLFDRARPRAGSPQVTERLKWGNHAPILSHRERRLYVDYTT